MWSWTILSFVPSRPLGPSYFYIIFILLIWYRNTIKIKELEYRKWPTKYSYNFYFCRSLISLSTARRCWWREGSVHWWLSNRIWPVTLLVIWNIIKFFIKLSQPETIFRSLFSDLKWNFNNFFFLRRTFVMKLIFRISRTIHFYSIAPNTPENKNETLSLLLSCAVFHNKIKIL